MMVQDRFFFDPIAGKYTVDRYLDDLQKRYGGVDAVLIWPTYPNLGIDDRNQIDMIHCMPGGVIGVRQIDRKSTRLNSSHGYISYAVFCLKKKNSCTIDLTGPKSSGPTRGNIASVTVPILSHTTWSRPSSTCKRKKLPSRTALIPWPSCSP